MTQTQPLTDKQRERERERERERTKSKNNKRATAPELEHQAELMKPQLAMQEMAKVLFAAST